VRRIALLVLGLLVCLAGLPAVADAQNRIFRDYRQDGQINPCDYSRGQLQRGLEGLPPDVEQYVPGLSDQLRRGCNQGAAPSGGGGEQTATPAPTGASGGPPSAPGRQRAEVPRPPAVEASNPAAVTGVAPDVSKGPGPDIPAWLAGLLAALGVGAVAVAVAVRYGALDPSGLARGVRAALAGRAFR
jgi:hypothetical protein